MADGPQAKVTLSADDSPLRQSLREMVGKMRDFGEEAKRSAEGGNGPLEMLRGRYAGLASLIGGGVMAAFVKHHVQLQDELSKAAQRAGVTTEAYSGMAYAAKLADVSTEQLTKTYAKLGATLSDAQQGQKSAVELFQRLKLDPKNMRDADDMLLAVADRISSVSDNAKRTGLVIDIFGEKLGPQLLPFLNQGRAGMEELRAEAQRLGVVVSTEAGAAAEKFNDTLTKIAASGRGTGQKLAAEVVPVLQVLADEFLRLQQGGSAAETIIKGVRIAFEAGLGARLPLRIGGKISPLSGDPLDADVTVQSQARGSRTIRAADFFLSIFTTAMEPDEILHEAEKNLDDPSELTAGVRYAFSHYPADRYAVILWDHGGGWSGGYGGDGQDGTVAQPAGMSGEAAAAAAGSAAAPGEAPRGGGPLDQFCTDLTAQAKAGKIDPMIGRAAELELRLTLHVLGASVAEHAGERAFTDVHRNGLAGASHDLDQQSQFRLDGARRALLFNEKLGERGAAHGRAIGSAIRGVRESENCTA